MTLIFNLDDIDKEDLPIRCTLNPCIIKSFTTGATLLCGGSVIIETDRVVSIDELDRFLVPMWRDEVQNEIDGKLAALKQEVQQQLFETQVTGSKGDNYLVRFDNNYWTCGCVGFGFRRKCKHIEIAKERYSEETY